MGEKPSDVGGSVDAVRVLVADDQELMRDGLVTILSRQPGIIVVGDAPDGESAVRLALDLRPDVVLMDVRMPGVDGIRATAEMRAHAPEVRVLMLTTFDDDAYIVDALRAGAVGYILKNIPAGDLAAALRLASRGVVQLDPAAAGKLIGALGAGGARAVSSPPPAFDRLTEREREVMLLVAGGANNREIAERLVISEGTVKTHISSILSQLGLRDRTQIAVFVYQRGGGTIPAST